ncbi:hypothetical protein P153DRAFT_64755 [Dothidotthia symphoricarpi CBS 119687]|uniref:Uncharacterized protein n=1 Tax=Dothidotthia symphoricarpi CBS 119687 TaxID=1392245 RepID=A0A6A6A9L7_9PLEO|nr:uncharacterized protein P153DRAFT_64755 [Dothidotthia symphoricarpi CBS 119687]KAF2127361.1 hypothetical protein P153DRAFT_64755 [Dothidotthia symphoricarpi CBS 119687]
MLARPWPRRTPAPCSCSNWIDVVLASAADPSNSYPHRHHIYNITPCLCCSMRFDSRLPCFPTRAMTVIKSPCIHTLPPSCRTINKPVLTCVKVVVSEQRK